MSLQSEEGFWKGTDVVLQRQRESAAVVKLVRALDKQV